MVTPCTRAILLRTLPAIVWAASMAGCTEFAPSPSSSATAPPPAAAPAPAPAPIPAPAPAPAAAVAPAAAPAPAPPIPVLAIDDAVLKAANDLFSKSQIPPAGAATRQAVVIDPLVDGVSGAQSNATRSLESRIIELVQAKYPQFEVLPFSTSNVAKAPIVLVGTFTAIDLQNKVGGAREAFRICLALADLKSGKIVSKGTARAQTQGVDISPTAYFRDSPTWAKDPLVDGYVKTCQGTKVGDPIDPLYLDGVMTAVLVSDAINFYNGSRYRESLDMYKSALRSPAGEQLRVFNGIYLASWKLGRKEEAAQAFGRIVDYGLSNKRLAVKFLFKPGSTSFWADSQASGPYPVWLRQIAQRTSQANACLEIVGHTSRTGPEPLNDRLSLLRAEYIKQRLEFEAPQLSKRTIAGGKGSRENIVGTASDDASDALDRRVEFKVISCESA
jgi:outer membrane protein OmpA-like peptidoglycan-associated protein